ncbi:carbamoyl-phosphate synthase large subunit [Corallococcus sp. CA053C]|nr:carbamoyl-phosphate synthase large subunit [Corallococcus sp. CA053C]
MPRREDIQRVLVIGSGPIVIGQACEFDYSGTQAIKALREEGLEVILLNSNPATVMTDPDVAHKTYVEPITPEVAERIIARERPDSLLATMGGQTALNLAKVLAQTGVLERYGVRLIGANIPAIEKAEDRQLFKAAMQRIGMPLPRSGIAHTVAEALALAETLGYPTIVRPSFTLGGTGGGIARNAAELEEICSAGLRASPSATVLVEESVLGWKEYELEVVRDTVDNAVIVCAIENFDPMGVHTGDSITVAPAQTLTDREYQRLRQASLAIIREIGVDTGGANIQFGVNPRDGRMVVIEMNPRVSRSSALASKATGYPIAWIAAKLALGYRLDELGNGITRTTPASFEPTLDYVVVKVPRFDFEKFPGADDTLTTSMKAVGEVMSIGRTFKEAYLKAMRSLEVGRLPLEPPVLPEGPGRRAALEATLRRPHPGRPWFLAQAFREGLTVEAVHALCAVDPWFLTHLKELVEEEGQLKAHGRLEAVPREVLFQAKQHGFSDRCLARLWGCHEDDVRADRHARGVTPVYKRVDTCAGEFEAYTPFFYSTYEEEDEAAPTARRKILILGSGPIRIGQGIEFDYCCVHAAFALREAGYETVMVNCNPETVSTDPDTADRLYLEPVTLEDVLAVVERERPEGVIVQFGGQTPLRLVDALSRAGVPILGTSADSIDRAEDRERFAQVISELKLLQPRNAMARSREEALRAAAQLGYPVMVRPSYVLGGRAMEVVRDEAELLRYITEAVRVSPEHVVLIDCFLREAIEVDVDLVADRLGRVRIAGVLEHVEHAGVHSGDAACCLPPYSLSAAMVETLKAQATAIARALDVVGLLNVQFAIQGEDVYVLEANPRASRTVPFISKATGTPLAKVAALCMVGRTLEELGEADEPTLAHVSIKESVFPFNRFPGADVALGPEMKSTGEVMGIASDVHAAFAKSQAAAGFVLPLSGRVLLSVRDEDKPGVVELARRLLAAGFTLVATEGTHRHLAERGVDAELARKDAPGGSEVVARITRGELALIITTTDARPLKDAFAFRRTVIAYGLPYFTTLQAARMAVGALEAMQRGALTYRSLQEVLRASGCLDEVTSPVEVPVLEAGLEVLAPPIASTG